MHRHLVFQSFFLFFFTDTATTEIYTLSLHDALPTSPSAMATRSTTPPGWPRPGSAAGWHGRRQREPTAPRPRLGADQRWHAKPEAPRARREYRHDDRDAGRTHVADDGPHAGRHRHRRRRLGDAASAGPALRSPATGGRVARDARGDLAPPLRCRRARP